MSAPRTSPPASRHRPRPTGGPASSGSAFGGPAPGGPALRAGSAAPAAGSDPAAYAAAAFPTSPKGEVPAQPGVGAPAFSTFSSSRSSSSTSDIPSDSTLLSVLAAGELDPEQIAAHYNIRLDLFLDWASAPETIKRVNMLIQGRAHVRHQKHEALRDEALNNLVRLQREAIDRNDPVEARRACIGVLRSTSRNSAPLHLFTAGGLPAGNNSNTNNGALSLSRFPTHYRTRSRIIRTAPLLREPPAILPLPEHPVAAESPAAITTKLLHRLQDSDNPNRGDGLRSLFNHFTPEWHEQIGVHNADDFARTDLFGYVQLVGHHSAILLPTVLPPDRPAGTRPLAATQEADLIDLDGEKRRVVMKFTRESDLHPWLINDMRLNRPPPPDPAPCNCPKCTERSPPNPDPDPPPDPPSDSGPAP